jgi:hypothetical protein
MAVHGAQYWSLTSTMDALDCLFMAKQIADVRWRRWVMILTCKLLVYVTVPCSAGVQMEHEFLMKMVLVHPRICHCFVCSGSHPPGSEGYILRSIWVSSSIDFKSLYMVAA